MPFISKDWRSPGEEWVKTEEGWEKKKILELVRHNCLSQQENMETSDINQPDLSSYSRRWERLEEEDKENNSPLDTLQSSRNNDGSIQPHCHITIKCTREIAGFNGLGDALKRLDFRSAVHDVRRFNYICKLMELLISQKLSTLSGCAQKQLFHMLEEVAYQVSSSQQNVPVLHKLLHQLRALIDCACWGRPLGSTQLWAQHLRTIDRIRSIANTIQIEVGDDVSPKLQDLPEECLREVLLRLNDHRDIESSGRAYAAMRRLAGERRIWRELCRFHFTPQQISSVHPPKDWKDIYHTLRKSVGLREEYAETILLCRNCRCLFWRSTGHPCIADQDPEFLGKLDDVDKTSLHIPIPPQAFLKFFSL